ncbi:24746_t:CDS:1, partial [Cetraspora pellucida]
KTQELILLKNDYFEACLKNWQTPYIILYDTEFNIINKELINIPKNAFKIDKYTSIETENVKLSDLFLLSIYQYC